MRILIAHSPYQQRGGEDRVVEEEAAMLQRHGHIVETLLLDNDGIQSMSTQMLAGLRFFYSVPSARELGTLIDRFKPDVMHVHNFMPTLSPSVFFTAKRRQVPVVQTLHNYRMICANAMLFREGHICEECPASGSFLPGIRHACYRGSHLGSAVVGGTMALHGSLGTWRSRVNRYIVLTHFAARKLASSRIPRDRIRVKPNFVADTAIGAGCGDFALYAGRLSPEKGLDTLIAADKAGLLSLPVKVAGDGPMMSDMLEAAARPKSRLQILGAVERTLLRELMLQARALIVPSLWYEPCPMVIMEALACGLPVICSRLGGLPELVGEDHPELLFTAGDPQSLAAALSCFSADAAGMQRFRRSARLRFETYYSEATNYQQLLRIYSEVVELPSRAKQRA